MALLVQSMNFSPIGYSVQLAVFTHMFVWNVLENLLINWGGLEDSSRRKPAKPAGNFSLPRSRCMKEKGDKRSRSSMDIDANEMKGSLYTFLKQKAVSPHSRWLSIEFMQLLFSHSFVLKILNTESTVK